MANKYITTTLPYVNADPHIGFAVEVLQADVTARHWRLWGHTVFFNTGTDEHGQKIAQKADEKGESRQVYVDHYADEFKKLGAALNLSYDRFIRTTDSHHEDAAQALWRLCDAAGDIYKKKFGGLYCVGCESFKTDSDLIDGMCPEHSATPLEHVEEENYFFRLSKYQSYLVEYLNRPGVIVPEWRRQEALTFVEKGLEDFSISREKARLDWGVSVPDDDTQVMYVWFDALTNYISTLGWPLDTDGAYEKFWSHGEAVQCAGKDQVRFQSVMWQAMLKSASLAPTGSVFYHGFVISDGKKMSKSIGNVISPYDLIRRYGTDATRYLLLRHVHPFEDTDVTWNRLDEWYNAHLANGIGNLVSRVLKMSEDNLEEPVTVADQTLESVFSEKLNIYRFDEALDYVFARVGELDAQIQETQPFKLFKSEDEAVRSEGRVIVTGLVQQVYRIAEHLAPCMPETAQKIKDAVRKNRKPETLFARL